MRKDQMSFELTVAVTPPSASLPLLALKSFFFFPVAVCDSQFVIFSVA